MKNKIILIEIFFSIVIIISVIFIITVLSLEIKLYTDKINKKSEATMLATNIIENIKSRNYDDISKYIEEISYIGVSKKIEGKVQEITVSGNEFSEKFFGTEIPKDYIVEVKIEDLNEDFKIEKNISIHITYYINGIEDNIEITNIIGIDNIAECNEPIISDEYFSEFMINQDDYEIIPVKYSQSKKSYVITTQNDKEWFNYNIKKWAKVLVFSKDADNIQDLFLQEDGSIKDSINYNNYNLNIKDYMYVWIPNFSIKDNITYFRYGVGKKSIKLDFLYSNGKYLYLNKIAEEIRDISEECSFDGIYGVWRKLGDEQDIYYKNFNSTQYAPINLY